MNKIRLPPSRSLQYSLKEKKGQQISCCIVMIPFQLHVMSTACESRDEEFLKSRSEKELKASCRRQPFLQKLSLDEGVKLTQMKEESEFFRQNSMRQGIDMWHSMFGEIRSLWVGRQCCIVGKMIVPGIGCGIGSWSYDHGQIA